MLCFVKINFLLAKYTWTFMHSVQTIKLQAEYVLSLFSMVHFTISNLLTFLGKGGDMGPFIHYKPVGSQPDMWGLSPYVGISFFAY